MKKEKTLKGLNPVLIEAMRYIDNAQEILRTKAKRVGDVYEDKKYVKMAGHTAYTGILFALDNCGIMPQTKKNQRLDVKDYQSVLAKQNKTMLNYFNECYEQLHLVAGYDGYGNKKYLTLSLQSANKLIDWAANKVN